MTLNLFHPLLPKFSPWLDLELDFKAMKTTNILLSALGHMQVLYVK
jgi:hypothetical protein